MKKECVQKISLLILSAILCVTAIFPVSAESVAVSRQKLLVNGEYAVCEKYNIDGYNYFKLRDLAALLNGTESSFSVEWDEEASSVVLSTDGGYIPDGSELILPEADLSGTAVRSRQNIFIDGRKQEELTVYNVGGYNFFMLRELAAFIGFEVGYDEENDTASVVTPQKEPENTTDVSSDDGGTVFFDTAESGTSSDPGKSGDILPDGILYADGNFEIKFLRLEKQIFDATRASAYFSVCNKSGKDLFVKCDALGFDSYSFCDVVLNEKCPDNKSTVVCVQIDRFDAGKIKDGIKNVCGQFVFSENADFAEKAFCVTFGKPSRTLPDADGTLLHSDGETEIYYCSACDGYRGLDIILSVKNKTGKTLVFRNEMIGFLGAEYDKTIMACPVLPYSTGTLRVTVKDFDDTSVIPRITSVSGVFTVSDGSTERTVTIF